MAYLPPRGAASSPVAARVSGKTFVMEPNSTRVKSVTFDFTRPDAVVTIRAARRSHKFVCGAGAWREGALTLFPFHAPAMVASGVWTDDNTFAITLRFHETPYVHTLACRFDGDRLAIDGALNVAFGPTAYALAGRIEG